MQRRFDGEGTAFSHPFSAVASYDSCAVLAYGWNSGQNAEMLGLKGFIAVDNQIFNNHITMNSQPR